MTLKEIREKNGLDVKTTSKNLDTLRTEAGLLTLAEQKAKQDSSFAYGGYSADAYRPYEQVKRELDTATARRNTYDNAKAARSKGLSGLVWQARKGEENTEAVEKLDKLIDDYNRRIEKLTREAAASRYYEYANLMKNEDFAEKSQHRNEAGSALYNQINNPNKVYATPITDDFDREDTNKMTEKEVSIFNYIYATQGEKAAQEYFDYLRTDAPDPLDKRRGEKFASNFKTDVGRALYSGFAALDNTPQGIKQLFTSEPVKPTVSQYAAAKVKEDAETPVGEFLIDTSATVGNMVPSILASTVVTAITKNPTAGKAVGQAIMGASIAGNTYTQAINKGMTPRQAMNYSALVGGSEIATGYLLGGISALGKNPFGNAANKLISGGKFAKILGSVDNAFIRFSAKMAGSVAGEIAEEEAQLFLEPLFEAIITDTKFDAPEWEEIAYTALITAASTGLLEAPTALSETAAESRRKKAEKIIRDTMQRYAEEKQGSTGALNSGLATPAEKTETDAANYRAAAENGSQRGISPFTDMVADYSEHLDANGQNTFMTLYDEAITPDVYVAEMRRAYDAGLNGEKLTETENSAVGEDKLKLAHQAGVRDAYVRKHDFGLVRNEASAKMNPKMMADLDSIGKRLRVRVQIVDRLRGGTANGSYKNGTISIARDAENPYMVVFKHEITHHLKQTASDAYKQFEDYVISQRAAAEGVSADAYIQAKITAAAQNGERLTVAEAREEIASDFTEYLMTDEKAIRRFVEAHSATPEGRNLIQTILDGIRRIIASIREALGGSKVTVDEAEASRLKLTLETMQKAEKLWKAALTEAGQSKTVATKSDGKTRNSRKDGIQNGVNWVYNAGILTKQEGAIFWENIANLNKRGYYVPKSATGEYIIEANNKLIFTNGDYTSPTINSVIALNDKSETNMSLAKEWIIDEESRYGRHDQAERIIEDVYGQGYVSEYSEPIGRAYVGKEQRGERANSRRTSEATRGEERLNITESDGKSMYSRKKRDADYLDAVKRGDIETAQRMVDEAAEETMGRSKIRDEDGKLIKVYHGSDSDFTVFDRTKGRSSMDIQGMFFSPWDIDAAGYGSNVRAFYLDIRNPAPEQTAYRALRRHQQENYAGVKAREDLERMNYDGVNNENEEYIAFYPTQVKSADPVTYDDNGNVIPLSERFNAENPDIRYSRKGRSMNELIEQYGAIPSGENPYRQVEVARKTERDKNVSQTVRTILEAQATPDAVVEDMKKLVEKGTFSFEAYTDKDAVAKAEAEAKDNWDKAMSDWFADAKKGIVSKDATAMGWVLYNNAANSGNVKTALDILDVIIRHQRNAAQALQATRILKKLSPEGQLYGIRRSVESLQKEIIEKYGKKAPNLKIDEVFAQRVLEAKTEKAREEAMQDIYRDIGRQMPSNFADKWNAWRYLAMLGNVRTHVRNIVGNAGFAPIVAAKSLTATAIERLVYSASGGKIERTKALPSGELLKAAWNDYATLTDEIKAGGKYNEKANANQYIEEGRVIFDGKLGKPVEALRRFNTKALSTEDEWFKQPHYAFALAQYCKANGITAEMLKAEKGPDKLRADKARGYAVQEAKKATYQDSNAFSDFISKLGKSKSKAVNAVVEGVLPFKRTPANILMRGIEYSPIGLVKAISADIIKVKKGDMTATQMIDNLASGLVGTALLGLGAILARMGLVRGGGDEDEDRKFSELQGHQAYSLEIGNKSYTLDWLAPEALPFFIGVNLVEQGSFKEMNAAEMFEAIGNISDPLLEMSCLQSLNDLIESVGNAYTKDISALYKMPVSAATSYLTQALPTILGQVERTWETKREQTYTTKGNKWLTTDQQYFLGKTFNKVPIVDVNQIPYIDAWGRETSTGNVAQRAGNNLLNPAYVSNIRTSDMEKELERLYSKTGEKSVIPERAEKSIRISDETIYLNKNQYVKYAKLKGQTSYDILTKITASKQYQALDDQSKVDLISKVYSYANALAKMEVTKSQSKKELRYVPEGWIAEAMATTEKTGIPIWKYIMIYDGQTGIVGLKDKQKNTIPLSQSLLVMEYVYSFIGLSDEQRQAIFEDFDVAKSVRHYSKAAVENKLKPMKAKAAK